MAEVELFSYEACPYAQRTRMALIEKGIPFKLTEVDLANKPDWFKQLSPHGKVPLLRHNGDIVYESRIINEYLDEVFPSPALLPQAPLARAKARVWIDYCDSYLLPTMHKLITDRKNSEQQQKNIAAVADRFRFMEHEGLRKLGDGPYWLGAEVSLVDLHYMPFMERFPCYVTLWGAVLPKECTRLMAWLETMKGRPSHRGTVTSFENHMTRYRRYDQAA